MDNQTVPAESEARKPCIACGEMIPAQATVCSHCLHSQVPEKPSSMKLILGWVGGISAILGLGATLMGGVHSLTASHAKRAAIKSEMALAEAQARQTQYSDAVNTYSDILHRDPKNRQAFEEQLSTVMLWLQDFHSIAQDGKRSADVAAANLDHIFPLLDAARVRVQGPRSADVVAHIGWAHWLNEKIAEREFGDAAEQNLRAALAIDSHNVYANAMLGNIMIANHQNFAEAIAHFNTAVATGQQRPLVRTMQLGVLVYEDSLSGRAELSRAVNDMRKNNEPLEDGEKHRILGWACAPDVSTLAERNAFLAAVPPADALATYQWLTQAERDDPWKTMQADFIQANVLELSGKRSDALAKYLDLQKQLKPDTAYNLRNEVVAAIKRLSQPA